MIGVGMTRLPQDARANDRGCGWRGNPGRTPGRGPEPKRHRRHLLRQRLRGLAIGQRIARHVGIVEVPIINLENACASSGGALREAQAWIDSDSAGTALVVGVEMLTHQVGGLISSDAHGIAERLGF